MADDGDGDYRRSEDYRRRASAAVLRATEDPSAISSLPQRLRFYTMSAVYILALKGVRAAVPHLVPVMAADLGFDFAAQGMLLASFFQGYFVTMIPAAKLTAVLGAKAVMGGCLGGSVAVFALLPRASRRFGVLGAQALLLALGLIQGGFTPALSTMNATWIPADGQEKVWAIRGQTLAGDALCQIVASVVTPALCSGGRWARACYACSGAAAVVTVLWQLLVRGSPGRAASSARHHTSDDASTRIAWAIFKAPAVQGLCSTWFCCVFASVAMLQMAPTVLMSRFNLTVAEAGRYIALGFSVTVPGMFLTGIIESFFVARGTSRLAIRRQCTLVSTLGVSCAMCGFVLSRSPLQAVAAIMAYNLAHQFNSSGFFPNLQEVGGLDTGIIQAVANSLGQLGGSMAPPLAFALYRRSGVWSGVYFISAGAVLVSGLFYRSVLELEPARDKISRSNS